MTPGPNQTSTAKGNPSSASIQLISHLILELTRVQLFMMPTLVILSCSYSETSPVTQISYLTLRELLNRLLSVTKVYIRVSHFNKSLDRLFTFASLRTLARLSRSVIQLGLAVSWKLTGCEIFFQRGPQRTPLQYSIAIPRTFSPYFGCSFTRSLHLKSLMILFPGLPLLLFLAWTEMFYLV